MGPSLNNSLKKMQGPNSLEGGSFSSTKSSEALSSKSGEDAILNQSPLVSTNMESVSPNENRYAPNSTTQPKHESRYWRSVGYPSYKPIDISRLDELGKRRILSSIKDLPPVRDFSNPVYNKLALLYYQTTDAKEKVAFIIKAFIIENLAKKHNLRFIGVGSGEGSFCTKILGRISDQDYSKQVFNDATFIEKSTKAIEQSKKFFSMKFEQTNKLIQSHKLSPEELTQEGLIDTTKLIITNDMVNGIQKIPLNYNTILAEFPSKDIKTPSADLVLLNHMLHYNDYESWVKISKEAFKLVSPGGALVILLHDLDYKPEGKNERSLGYFLEQLGGKTEDIDNFTRDVTEALKNSGATEFDRLIIETKNLLTDKECAEDIVKFLLSGANAKLIKNNEVELRKFIEEQKITSPNKGYEIAKADKMIVAYKRKN